jgi:hypothetical protein
MKLSFNIMISYNVAIKDNVFMNINALKIPVFQTGLTAL